MHYCLTFCTIPSPHLTSDARLMNLDTKSNLADVQSRAPVGLVPQILAVQANYKLQAFQTNDRREWAERLECLCLQVPREQRSQCRKRKWREEGEEGSPSSSFAEPRRTLGRRRRYSSENYVAVSYPWDASACEGPESGGWRIWSKRAGEFCPNQVRDVVLERATAYAKAHGLDLIWIDRECIPQDERDSEEKSEKECAIQSMDMVYRLYKFSWPVALLVVSINTEDDMVLLGRLLLYRFTRERKNEEYPILTDEVAQDPEKALKILELLQRITSDPWWSRAWIFQEDYCARTEMHLLIPHSRLVNKHTFDHFGNIPGELSVNSSEFRRVATIFCLAYKHDPVYAKEKVGVAMCNDILSKAGKYNIVHKYAAPARDEGKWKAMTSTILADIGRRGITNASDLLAIAANCCTYTSRLDTKALKDAGYSLTACILALYFLNGEVFCEGSENLASQNVYEYLTAISLDFRLPVRSKELTFLKYCRFPLPSLCAEGVQTEGWLWRIDKTVAAAEVWEKVKKPPRKGLKKANAYALCLLQLAKQLLPSVGADVSACLHEEHDGDLKCIKDAMACKLVESLLEGKTLMLGKLVSGSLRGEQDGDDGNKGYSAIFILDDEDSNNKDENEATAPDQAKDKPRYAFTASASGGTHASSREYDLAKFVSLQVSLGDTDTDTATSAPIPAAASLPVPVPVLRTHCWINGLAFPGPGSTQRKIVFSWPAELGAASAERG